MIQLQELKNKFIGKQVKYPPLRKIFTIADVRQLECGKILVYNKFNWCCDINIVELIKEKITEKGDST